MPCDLSVEVFTYTVDNICDSGCIQHLCKTCSGIHNFYVAINNINKLEAILM